VLVFYGLVSSETDKAIELFDPSSQEGSVSDLSMYSSSD
jgi:hypothetical protein